MNDGKTYEYFSTVYQRYKTDTVPPYRFVMKTDDDVFLHLGNMEARLAAMPYNEGVYFGRHVPATGIFLPLISMLYSLL